MGAIYFHEEHFDFLKPDEAKYPKEISSVSRWVASARQRGLLRLNACIGPSWHLCCCCCCHFIMGQSRPAKTRLRGKTSLSASDLGCSNRNVDSAAAFVTAAWRDAPGPDSVLGGEDFAAGDGQPALLKSGKTAFEWCKDCKDGYASCRLCPWRRACKDTAHAISLL